MLSVLIPTKGRPEKLERCVKSIDVYCEIEILATRESDVSEFTEQDPRVSVLYDFDHKYSIIQAQNLMAERARFDLLPISDDIEFDRGSIQKALDMLYRPTPLWDLDGDGVVSFHVRNMDCADYAYCLVGKKFYKDTLKGQLFFPGYQHFFADQELGEIAKKRKNFVRCLDATILNYHPNAGFAEDETHRHRRGEKLAHDQELYDHRVLHGQIP